MVKLFAITSVNASVAMDLNDSRNDCKATVPTQKKIKTLTTRNL